MACYNYNGYILPAIPPAIVNDYKYCALVEITQTFPSMSCMLCSKNPFWVETDSSDSSIKNLKTNGTVQKMVGYNLFSMLIPIFNDWVETSSQTATASTTLLSLGVSDTNSYKLVWASENVLDGGSTSTTVYHEATLATAIEFSNYGEELIPTIPNVSETFPYTVIFKMTNNKTQKVEGYLVGVSDKQFYAGNLRTGALSGDIPYIPVMTRHYFDSTQELDTLGELYIVTTENPDDYVFGLYQRTDYSSDTVSDSERHIGFLVTEDFGGSTVEVVWANHDIYTINDDGTVSTSIYVTRCQAPVTGTPTAGMHMYNGRMLPAIPMEDLMEYSNFVIIGDEGITRTWTNAPDAYVNMLLCSKTSFYVTRDGSSEQILSLRRLPSDDDSSLKAYIYFGIGNIWTDISSAGINSIIDMLPARINSGVFGEQTSIIWTLNDICYDEESTNGVYVYGDDNTPAVERYLYGYSTPMPKIPSQILSELPYCTVSRMDVEGKFTGYWINFSNYPFYIENQLITEKVYTGPVNIGDTMTEAPRIIMFECNPSSFYYYGADVTSDGYSITGYFDLSTEGSQIRLVWANHDLCDYASLSKGIKRVVRKFDKTPKLYTGDLFYNGKQLPPVSDEILEKYPYGFLVETPDQFNDRLDKTAYVMLCTQSIPSIVDDALMLSGNEDDIVCELVYDYKANNFYKYMELPASQVNGMPLDDPGISIIWSKTDMVTDDGEVAFPGNEPVSVVENFEMPVEDLAWYMNFIRKLLNATLPINTEQMKEAFEYMAVNVEMDMKNSKRDKAEEVDF